MAGRALQAATTDPDPTQIGLKARVSAARRGVTVAEAAETMESWSVPVTRFAAILGCSERTWWRARGGPPEVVLPAAASDRLLRTLRVLTHAGAVFDGKADARAWMSSPNAALGGASPLALLDTAEGVRLVDEVLTRLEFGVYA